VSYLKLQISTDTKESQFSLKGKVFNPVAAEEKLKRNKKEQRRVSK